MLRVSLETPLIHCSFKMGNRKLVTNCGGGECFDKAVPNFRNSFKHLLLFLLCVVKSLKQNQQISVARANSSDSKKEIIFIVSCETKNVRQSLRGGPFALFLEAAVMAIGQNKLRALGRKSDREILTGKSFSCVFLNLFHGRINDIKLNILICGKRKKLYREQYV